MKVAILHTSLDVQGGAERQVLMLAIGLKKKGHDATVYVSKLDKEKCYPDLINKIKVVECGGFGYKDIKKTILFSPHYMNKMSKSVKGCDLINCHNYPTIYAAVKLKRKFNAPIIWMCNEPPFPPLYKGGEYSKTISSLIYRIVVFHFLTYNQIISEKIDRIMVLDKMNYERIRKTYKKNPTIIHTGLDFPASIKSKKIKNKFVVLAVGRIDKGKRTEDAIKSIEYLKNKIPNILLNIVGGGKMMDSMKNLVKKSNLENYVIFHGKVSDKKLSELYSECDVFLFTAENQSWGLVPLEAMSYGKPCVVSTGAGVSEVLKDRVNCLKINPRDVKGIVNSVLLLNKNKKIADKIARNGRNFVKKEFSWNKYVNEMERVFLNAVKTNK